MKTALTLLVLTLCGMLFGTATASDGLARGLLMAGPSTLTVRDSSFLGSTSSVGQSSGTLKVISSELDGAVQGILICVGDYDGSGTALANGTFGSGGCV